MNPFARRERDDTTPTLTEQLVQQLHEGQSRVGALDPTAMSAPVLVDAMSITGHAGHQVVMLGPIDVVW